MSYITFHSDLTMTFDGLHAVAESSWIYILHWVELDVVAQHVFLRAHICSNTMLSLAETDIYHDYCC